MSYESFALSLDPVFHVPMDNIGPDRRVEDVVAFIESKPTDAVLVSHSVVDDVENSVDVSGGKFIDFS